MSVVCPLCEQDQHSLLLCVDGYDIVRCADCGFIFVWPPPTAASLRAFYECEDYFSGDMRGYANYFNEQQRHRQLAQARLKRIEGWLPQRGTVVDIGCAAGFFIAEAQRRGWQACGVEISSSMAEYARRLTSSPIVESIEALGIAIDSLDVITLWEYIEHVSDPIEQLRRFSSFVRPGGVLALSTPNTAYWTAVYRPDRWREFKPPAHLGFFTAASIRRALEAAGWEVIHIRYALARPPSRPYALDRMLALVGDGFGRGNQRSTALWWLFGLGWRLIDIGSLVAYKLRWPDTDLHIGLEAYARKPQP